jgi:hypothetical protein
MYTDRSVGAIKIPDGSSFETDMKRLQADSTALVLPLKSDESPLVLLLTTIPAIWNQAAVLYPGP